MKSFLMRSTEYLGTLIATNKYYKIYWDARSRSQHHWNNGYNIYINIILRSEKIKPDDAGDSCVLTTNTIKNHTEPVIKSHHIQRSVRYLIYQTQVLRVINRYYTTVVIKLQIKWRKGMKCSTKSLEAEAPGGSEDLEG